MHIIYANITYRPHGKHRITRALVVDNGTIIARCLGSTFYTGRRNTPPNILKDALKHQILYDPDLHDHNPPAFHQLMTQYHVKFVDNATIERLLNDLPITHRAAD